MFLLGCLAGEVAYKERCYAFQGTKKTWADARTHCQGLATGYNLVVINDENEQEFLGGEISPGIDYWIGLQEGNAVHTYVWVDTSSLVYGSTLKQYPWDSVAPNNVSDVCPLIAIIVIMLCTSQLTKTPR